MQFTEGPLSPLAGPYRPCPAPGRLRQSRPPPPGRPAHRRCASAHTALCAFPMEHLAKAGCFDSFPIYPPEIKKIKRAYLRNWIYADMPLVTFLIIYSFFENFKGTFPQKQGQNFVKYVFCNHGPFSAIISVEVYGPRFCKGGHAENVSKGRICNLRLQRSLRD